MRNVLEMHAPEPINLVKVVPVKDSRDYEMLIYTATNEALAFIEKWAPRFGNYQKHTMCSELPPHRSRLYASPNWDIPKVITFLESYGKEEENE